MGDRRDEPFVNGWQIACFLIAVPIVYRFDQQFYEVVAVLSTLLVQVITESYVWLSKSFRGAADVLTQTQATALRAFGAFLLFAVATILLVVVGLLGLAVVLVLAVPALVAGWLVENPGPPRYLLDVVLVWFTGLLLYGVFFPIIWRIVEPLVALTLGEITFQRIRARVFGVRPRYSQPLYLCVAAIGLIGGMTRALAPVGSAAVASVEKGWREVSDPILRPTPRAWPKVFDVAAGQTVATGIVLNAQQEIGFETSAPVTAAVGGITIPGFRDSGNIIFVGTPARGEIAFRGGKTAARIAVVGPPHPPLRMWLAAGQTYRPNATWFDQGDGIELCVGPPNVLYRMRSSSGASRWEPLNGRSSCNPSNYHGIPEASKAGFVEVKTTAATWVAKLSVVRPMRYAWLHEGPDTKIPLRPGDRFRVSANFSELKVLNDGRTIPAFATADLTATWRGNLRLRPKDPYYNRADVTILARGPEWK